jgi:hypothetical protein
MIQFEDEELEEEVEEEVFIDEDVILREESITGI